MTQVTEKQIVELEEYIRNISIVIENPDYLDDALSAIVKVEENIHLLVPLINEQTEQQFVQRLQTCATTLSSLADNAEEKLLEVKEAVIKLKKSKKVSKAYDSSK